MFELQLQHILQPSARLHGFTGDRDDSDQQYRWKGQRCERYAGVSTTAGGSNIGLMVITVENGAYTATFTWIPNQIGTYPVYFTLNANKTILVEYNYGNDAASKNITVEVPINGGDFVVGNSLIRPNCTILPSPFPGWYNNITVIGTGTLTLNGYDMNMEESSQYGLQIIVQDHGTSNPHERGHIAILGTYQIVSGRGTPH